MAGPLDFVNAAGSVAGVVGLGYQVHSSSRDRVAARRAAASSTVERPPAAPPAHAPLPRAPGASPGGTLPDLGTVPGGWARPTTAAGGWAPPDHGRTMAAGGVRTG